MASLRDDLTERNSHGVGGYAHGGGVRAAHCVRQRCELVTRARIRIAAASSRSEPPSAPSAWRIVRLRARGEPRAVGRRRSGRAAADRCGPRTPSLARSAPRRPTGSQFGIDGRVLAFGVVATTDDRDYCVALCRRFNRHGRISTSRLRDGGTAVSAVKGQRLRSLLAAGQLALALVLLAGAGLMIKTTIRTFQFDAGYDASRVLVGDVSLAGGPLRRSGADYGVRGRRRLSVWSGFPASVLPSIARCSFADSAPLPERVTIDGRAERGGRRVAKLLSCRFAGYFSALGLPIRHGRDFSTNESGCRHRERRDGPRVCGESHQSAW